LVDAHKVHDINQISRQSKENRPNYLILVNI